MEPTDTTQNTSMTIQATVHSIPPAVQGGGVVGLAISLISFFFWIRRRFSSDGLANHRDDATEGLIRTLVAERDKAMVQAAEAWSLRSNDAKMIGELTGKVNHFTDVNEALRQELGVVRKELHELKLLVKALLPKQLGDAVLKGAVAPSEVLPLIDKGTFHD